MSETRPFEPPLTEAVTTENATIEEACESSSDQYDRRFQGTKTLMAPHPLMFLRRHTFMLLV